jgi:hypothetical protein
MVLVDLLESLSESFISVCLLLLEKMSTSLGLMIDTYVAFATARDAAELRLALEFAFEADE